MYDLNVFGENVRSLRLILNGITPKTHDNCQTFRQQNFHIIKNTCASRISEIYLLELINFFFFLTIQKKLFGQGKKNDIVQYHRNG